VNRSALILKQPLVPWGSFDGAKEKVPRARSGTSGRNPTFTWMMSYARTSRLLQTQAARGTRTASLTYKDTIRPACPAQYGRSSRVKVQLVGTPSSVRMTVEPARYPLLARDASRPHHPAVGR